MAAPLDGAASFETQLAKLREEMTNKIPTWEGTLKNIYEVLKADPDMVHLLTEEQVGQIVSGLQTKTQLFFAETTVKVGRGLKKGLTEDDI